MVKRFYLLIAVILLTNCSHRHSNLILQKTPYSGDELRIDGYYYSNLNSERAIGVAVFYRDGICIHMFTRPHSQDTIDFIEREIMLDNAFISEIKAIPTNIGVYKILYPDIEFEAWEYGGDGITTFSHFGEIINDTTFILNKRINNGGNYISSPNLTYRFKQFSPKPDSTNVWIK